MKSWRASASLDAEFPSWWRRTAYRHFGPDCDLATARAVVESPQAVVRHAFWPFVRYDKQVRRYDYATGNASSKVRPVQYPAQLDANIFAYYAEQLSVLYEKQLGLLGISEHVTAYRNLGRSNVDFAAEAFAWVRDRTPCSIHCFDVRSFFDNLDHKILKSAWCDLIGMDRLPADHFAVFQAVTQYASVQREDLPTTLHETEGQRKRYCTAAEFRRLRQSGQLRVARNLTGRGIPQGIQLSAVLSNLYMLDFDRCVAAEIAHLGGFYRRYSDDILIALPTCSETGFCIEQFLAQAMSERRLPLNEEKTTHHRATLKTRESAPEVTPPVTYLGLAYDGRRILLRGATLARFHRRMAHAVQRAQRRTEASESQRQLPKAKLRKRFTHIGRRNFLSYIRPIERILRQHGFDGANSVRRQLRRSQARLERLLDADGSGGKNRSISTMADALDPPAQCPSAQ